MGTSQLLAGNMVNLVIAVLALLEVIPWSIAGYLIVATVIIVILAFLRSKGGSYPDETLTQQVQTVRGTGVQGPRTHEEKKGDDRSVEHAESTPRTTTTKAPTDKAHEEGEKGEGKPGEGPTSIGEGDYLSYDIGLEEGEEVVGDVSASGDVNVYVLNEDNLNALDLDQEFWYEAGTEGVRNATVRFKAPDDGVWYFVVENDNSREVNATVKITVGRPSHSLPSLKTDGLELPDAKLEGKL